MQKGDLNIGKLVLFVNLACFLFTISDAIKKDAQVNQGVNPFEFNIIRSITSAGLSYIIGYRNGNTTFFPTVQRKILIARTVIMSCGMYLCLYCFNILPITIWAIVTNIQPFFIALI